MAITRDVKITKYLLIPALATVSFSAKYGAMKTAAYIDRHNKHRVTITDIASAIKPKNSDEVIFVTVE
ncbi:MAG: hypothetical protein HRU22_10955 [Gammaproteobacteria bacterium]|nr:hypothetical protein [Gammaproteobacteria bacterium]